MNRNSNRSANLFRRGKILTRLQREQLIVQEANRGVGQRQNGFGWWVERRGCLRPVVQDREGAGYGGSLAGLELYVIGGLRGVGERVQEDGVALASRDLEVGCVGFLGI
jgi:hypothetical protein